MHRPDMRISSPQKLFAVVGLVLASVASVAAQPISFDPDDPAPTLIPFRAEPKRGDVARVEGVVDENGRRFYLKELNVMSPLAIQVFAKDPARPVDVSLHRYFWRDANLEGRTDATGDWSYVGRVHDEVGIQLSAEEPAEFYILAWRGPQVKVDFAAPVFKAVGEGGAGGGETGGVGKIALWLVVALVAVVVLWLVGRRRGASAAMLLLLLAAPAVAQPDDFDGRLELAEGDIEWLMDWAERAVEQVDENFSRAKDEIRTGLEEVHQRIDDNETWVEETLQGMVDQIDENFARARGEIRGTENALQEFALDVASQIGSLQAAVESLQLLAEEDRRAIPDPTYGGVPPMVTRCFDSAECASCYEDTHAKLREQLELYSQLGVIYQTTDAYLIAMTGYGDAKSGWHQLEQAAWYAEKQKIVASHERLKAAYRDKLGQFNRRLWDTLQEYGTCEARFGLDDWFSRYGEPFYHALTASYRLP